MRTITIILGALCCMYSLEVFCQPSNSLPLNVRAWGDDFYGETNVPTSLTNVVNIAADGQCTLALKADGTVVAWGNNIDGQCNIPSNLTDVAGIAVGETHSLALRADGVVIGWGRNNYGECTAPPELTNAIAISAGTQGSLALKADSTVVAWGRNDFGETNVPSNLREVIKIAAGGLHNIVLLANGSLVAWGNNDAGQANVPPGLTNVTDVAAGFAHNLALRADGTILAWGRNDFGQANVPSGLTNIVAVAAGYLTSFALRSDGTLVAWGNNQNGECDVPSDLFHVVKMCGGTGHSVALVNAAQNPPIILLGPFSQTVSIGSTTYLSVSVRGYPPFSYQWFEGTNKISGATNSLLILNNIQPQQSGAYSVQVSNSAGSTNSQTAFLNVLPSLAINLVPAISLFGGVGLTYDIQYILATGPTNAPWNSLATVTLTNSPQFYSDYSAIGQPARFYRTVQLP